MHTYYYTKKTFFLLRCWRASPTIKGRREIEWRGRIAGRGLRLEQDPNSTGAW